MPISKRLSDYSAESNKAVLFFSASSTGDTEQLLDFGIREILVSYYYMRKSLPYYEKVLDELQKCGGLFMTDSGAFSFMGGVGADISEMTSEKYWIPYLTEYVDWLRAHKDKIFCAANLDLDKLVGRDVVRRWNEEYFEPLEKEGLQIVYVAHEDEGDPHAIKHFREYCKRYRYVGVNQTHKDYAVKFYQAAKEHNVRVHGFAWTELNILKHYPFFSSDSSVGYDSMVVVKDSEGNVLHMPVGEVFDRFTEKTEYAHESRALTEGYHTLAVDGANRIVWAPMRSVVRHRVTKTMYRLYIEGGIRLDVTEDHSLLQLNKEGDLIEVSAKDLKTGDYLITANRFPFDEDLTDDLFDETMLQFLGLWLGDGSYSGRTGINLSCYNTLETRRIIDEIAYRFGAKTTPSKNGVDCHISNKRLRRFMQDIGFEGHADTKRIPPFVYSLMESDIGWLLNGYFSADGTGSGLGVFTTSEGLKADVVLLLNGMGIFTSVTEHPPGHFFKDGKRYAKKRGWHISIRDTNSKKRFLEKIDFCIAYKHNAVFLDVLGNLGKEQLWAKKSGVPVELSVTGRIAFKRDTPLVSSLKPSQRRVNRDRNTSNFARKVVDNDVLFPVIRKVETLPVGEVEVFDLEVPLYENFIANGVVVHNTTWLGGVRYGTTYDYDGKNFRTIDYKHKHIRKLRALKYKKIGVSLDDVLGEEKRKPVNRMNLLGWMGFRKEFLKMANLKLHNRTVAHYK